MNFLNHIHPLILKVEEPKPRGSDYYRPDDYGLHDFDSSNETDSDKIITCYGCSETIKGPFYSCEECDEYYLHKICAELPSQMKHPMHPEHPLTLLEVPLTNESTSTCFMCGKSRQKFLYSCQICKLNVDLLCAISSQTILDKCHMHPLIPIQFPTTFPCHICDTIARGFSYKCGICPFWAHQHCTLLQNTVEHSSHNHPLNLLNSIPKECHDSFTFLCDICHRTMTTYGTVYSCVGCLFFAHPNCATSSQIQESSDGENELEDDDSRKSKILPVREWTSLLRLIVKNFEDADNLRGDEIDHFSHNHKLYLHDEGKDITCDACAQPISGPSYGCTECNYFLHQFCVNLPRFIIHPYHEMHKIMVFEKYPTKFGFFRCSCCLQYSNTFFYKCDKTTCNFTVDLKCAFLSSILKHQGHEEHDVILITGFSTMCNACNKDAGSYILKCSDYHKCRYNICHSCAMLPSVIDHRYCEHGLRLRYSAISNYDREYICDLCEEKLHPKCWFYHCDDCDQFSHSTCLIDSAGDSNIKYGKNYDLPEHNHPVTLTPFTRDFSRCSLCTNSLTYGFAVGFKCATCDFKAHLKCVKSWDE